MKLILSRKGFDSRYGGMPSPILPDGRLISFPITPSSDRTTFGDVNAPDVHIGKLIRDLSRGAYSIDTRIHLDPDLDRLPSRRLPGWRPAFGQSGSAQGHLRRTQVGPGDVFIFFGWFREVECVNGVWCYKRDAPHIHVLFGWLEIADMVSISRELDRCLALYPWSANHAHVYGAEGDVDPNNTLYVAAQTSRFSARAEFGGGRFPLYKPRLLLTRPGSSRSIWRLPAWFSPREGVAALTYHSVGGRWQQDDEFVTLRSVAIGQEFVLDADDYPEAEKWASGLIGQCS